MSREHIETVHHLRLDNEQLRLEADELRRRINVIQQHPGERYWEGRWRDADQENAVLKARLAAGVREPAVLLERLIEAREYFRKILEHRRDPDAVMRLALDAIAERAP